MTEKESKRLECLEAKLKLILLGPKVVSPTADYTVLIQDSIIVLPTAAANARDVTFPDPTKHKRRELTVVNLSGASQNILSHNGTALTLKTTSGAATATHAVENASSVSTGRRKFVSDGTVWVLTGI